MVDVCIDEQRFRRRFDEFSEIRATENGG